MGSYLGSAKVVGAFVVMQHSRMRLGNRLAELGVPDRAVAFRAVGDGLGYRIHLNHF